MIRYINILRRKIAKYIYVEKSWVRENRLSIKGIFDYALSNRSKRNIIRHLSKTGSGNIRYNQYDDKLISVDYISEKCRNTDPYVMDYVDESKLVDEDDEVKFEEYNEAVSNNNKLYMNARKEFTINNIIPELIQCKVFEIQISNEDESINVSDINKLLDLGVYERTENKDNNLIDFSYSYNRESEYNIDGIKTGKRFKYAAQALHAVYCVDKEHEFAPNLFSD